MRSVATFLHSGGAFTSVSLTGQEITSGTFGGIFVVLETVSGPSEI
jgi:hypothetical protein